MANRHILAVNKLEEFKAWLIEKGWHIEEPIGKYEVLRARIETERVPLIVYTKDSGGLVHLSVSDYHAKFVREFIENKNHQGFGKFKNAESLYKAYCELEKEFTKKSQRLNELEETNQPTHDQNERLKYKLGLIVRDNQELNRKIAELKEELGDWKVDGNMTILEKQLEIKKLQTQLYELPKKICEEIYNACYNDETPLFDRDDLRKIIIKIQKKYEVNDGTNNN